MTTTSAQPDAVVDLETIFPRHSFAMQMATPLPEECIRTGDYVVLSATVKATQHCMVAVRGEPPLIRRVSGATATKLLLADNSVVDRGGVVGVVVGVLRVMEVG